MLLVGWGLFNNYATSACILTISDDTGDRTFKVDLDNVMHSTLTSYSSVSGSTIRFDQVLGICWTAYVLTSHQPPLPPAPSPPPLPPAMCSLCWPGHGCSEGAATPEPCQPGTYALLGGQPSCESCPKGSYQNETGATSCATCPAGSHNPTLGGRSSFACTRCAPGSFSAMMGNANVTCTSCAAGRYSETLGEMSCRACEPGDTACCSQISPLPFSPVITTALHHAVRYCSPLLCYQVTYTPFHGTGGYCPDPGAASRLSRRECRPGTFNEEAGSSHEGACHRCLAGTSNPRSGARSSQACKACRPGSFANVTGSGECSSCDPGSFQSARNATACKVQRTVRYSSLYSGAGTEGATG